jgi:hypothetical protein
LSVTAATAQDEIVRNGFILTLTTTYQPAEALVRISNRGTREIGPVFVDSQGLVNDLLGQDEKLGALFTAATDFAEYHAAGAFAEVPIDTRGMRVSLFGLHSWSTPIRTPEPWRYCVSRARCPSALRASLWRQDSMSTIS